MDVRNLMHFIRGGLIQQDRLLKLDTSLGHDMLLPHQMIGDVRLGRDFEFVVDVVSTTSSVELKNLIAQPATLWIQQGGGSYAPHNGYVHTARRLGADGGLTFHQLTISSWMHFLRFRRDQKIWQDKPVDRHRRFQRSSPSTRLLRVSSVPDPAVTLLLPPGRN